MERMGICAKEAADLIGVSLGTLYEMIKEDSTFPAFTIGKRGSTYVIPVDELRQWVNKKGRQRAGLQKKASEVAALITLARQSQGLTAAKTPPKEGKRKAAHDGGRSLNLSEKSII